MLLAETGGDLLESAAAAGSVRDDVSIGELLAVVNAIADAAASGAGDVLHLLSLIRYGATPRGRGDLDMRRD